MSDRLGELEMLSRTRELTPEESDELAAIITAEKRRSYQRAYGRAYYSAAKRRERYAADPAYRAWVLAKNERSRLRRAGRA